MEAPRTQSPRPKPPPPREGSHLFDNDGIVVLKAREGGPYPEALLLSGLPVLSMREHDGVLRVVVVEW